MDPVQAAVEAREKGFNCAQAVLSAYAAQHGLDSMTALRMASSLGGGLSRHGETCGAVTGALLVIGLNAGTDDPADQEAKDRVYQLGDEFMQAFCQRHRTTRCRDLLGCDISLPEGLQFARENQLFSLFCGSYVQSAAEILEEMRVEDK